LLSGKVASASAQSVLVTSPAEGPDAWAAIEDREHVAPVDAGWAGGFQPGPAMVGPFGGSHFPFTGLFATPDLNSMW
jgi:hypothetical protein